MTPTLEEQAHQMPTVSYQELIKNPKNFLNKTVRLQTILSQEHHGQLLCDLKQNKSGSLQCGESWDPGHLISAGFPGNLEKQRILAKQITTHLKNLGGNATKVTVIGVFREKEFTQDVWFNTKYHFEIEEFEKFEEPIFPYQGFLQNRLYYQAQIECRKKGGVTLVPPINDSIETNLIWTNLRSFPTLRRKKSTACQRQIVFQVIFAEVIEYADKNNFAQYKWVLKCRILRIE